MALQSRTTPLNTAPITQRASWPKDYSSPLPATSRLSKRKEKLEDSNGESKRRKIQLQQGSDGHRPEAVAFKMTMLNSKHHEGPPPYVRHGSSISSAA